MNPLELVIIGRVSSPLLQCEDAPRFEDENAPSAHIIIEKEFVSGLRTLEVGDEITLLTWLHEANRKSLEVFPRGDTTKQKRGVFNTRSASRPNPIGLHIVHITEIEKKEGTVLLMIDHLEAIHGTPIIDIKTSREQRIRNRERQLARDNNSK